MQRKLLVGLGLVLLFIVVFAIAFVVVFPLDSTKHYAEQLIAKQLSNKQTVKIDSLKVSPLLNVTLKSITLTPTEQEKVDSKSDVKEGDYKGYFCSAAVDIEPFTIDEIFVNPSVFSTIGGNPNGSFKISIDKGVIDGSFKTKTSSGPKSDKTDKDKAEDKDQSADNAGSEQETDNKKTEKGSAKNKSAKNKSPKKQTINIEAKGKDLALENLTILSNMMRTQVFGELSFDANAVLQKNGSKTSVAMLTVNVSSEGTAVCPKRIKNFGPLPFFDLPFMIIGDITGDMEMSEHKLTINSFVSTGPDIQIDLSGSIEFKANGTPGARFNLKAKILPSEEWLAENEMYVIYQACRRQDDGSIELKVTGPSKKPKMDCGTPIPVEKPAVAKKTEKKETPDPEKPKKAEKKPAEEKKKVEKPELPPEPAPGTPAEIEEDKPKRRINRGSDDPLRNRPNGGRASRAFGDNPREGASTGDLPRRGPGRRAQLDRVEGDIARDEGRRRRGDMEFNNNGEPMDRD